MFDDTPEAITAWGCSHLGVPFGSDAPTGIKVYMPCLGKRAYEAIMAAYTAASRQNGKKYIPMMRDVNKVCVIEKGALCGTVLEGGYNLTEASYKTSLQNMVNRVVVTNKEGGQVGVAEEISRLDTMEVLPIPDRVLLDTAEREFLDRKALDYNETRNPVTAATGTQLFTGEVGAAIPQGTGAESDDSFQQRIFDKIRRPITSGNRNHFIYWAKLGVWGGRGHCAGRPSPLRCPRGRLLCLHRAAAAVRVNRHKNISRQFCRAFCCFLQIGLKS